jgi:hypothetical protein
MEKAKNLMLEEKRKQPELYEEWAQHFKTSIEGIGIYTNEDRTFNILINQSDHITVSYEIKDKGLNEAI